MGAGEGEAVLKKIPFESIYTAVENIPLNLAFSPARRNFTSPINVFWDSFLVLACKLDSMRTFSSNAGLILVLLVALVVIVPPLDHSSGEAAIKEYFSKLHVERSIARIPTHADAQNYEYCQLSDESTAIDRALAGEEVDSTTLAVGDVDQLRSLGFSDIQYVNEPRPKRYTIAVIGVGYSNDDVLKNDVVSVANKIDSLFGDFELNVLYSYEEVPFTLVSVDGFLNLPPDEEIEALFESFKKRADVDGIVVAFDSEDFYAGSRYVEYNPELHEVDQFTRQEFVAMISGRFVNLGHLLAHEIGHGFGLHDGYQRYYGVDDMGGSTLFRTVSDLNSLALQSISSTDPVVIDTGGTCNGEKTYSLVSSGVMTEGVPVEPVGKPDLISDMFTPFEIEYMRQYLSGHISSLK